MRPLLITQNTSIHGLAVSIYHIYSFSIIDSTTSSTTYARWWCEESFTVWWWCGVVIVIRPRISYVSPVRVCMSHKMGQSAYWAYCCCWLRTDQDGVQRVCRGGSALRSWRARAAGWRWPLTGPLPENYYARLELLGPRRFSEGRLGRPPPLLLDD